MTILMPVLNVNLKKGLKAYLQITTHLLKTVLLRLFQFLKSSIYDKCFLHERKKKCKSTHTNSEWITIGLAKSCDTKNKLRREWQNCRSSKSYNKFINYKHILDEMIGKVNYDERLLLDRKNKCDQLHTEWQNSYDTFINYKRTLVT